MPESLPADSQRDELHLHLKKLVGDIHKLGEAPAWDQQWYADVFRHLAGLQAFLAASASSIGECRKAYPFAKLKPVLEANGTLRWCCEHDPSHCSSGS